MKRKFRQIGNKLYINKICLTVAWCNFYSFTNLIHSHAKAINISRLPIDTQIVYVAPLLPTLLSGFSHFPSVTLKKIERESYRPPTIFAHTKLNADFLPAKPFKRIGSARCCPVWPVVIGSSNRYYTQIII